MIPDVIVVGAGAIGSAIAYQLSKAGMKVTVLDRGRPGGEATRASAGMIIANPGGENPASLDVLASESARMYPALAAELKERTGIDIGFRRTGVVEVAFDELEEHELRIRRGRRADRGARVAWLDGPAAFDLEPAINPAIRSAIYGADHHHLLAGKLAPALLRAAADLGASVREGAAVDGLVTDHARIVGVRVGNEVIHASEVVLANGAWAMSWSTVLQAPIPVRPIRGQMVQLRTTTTALRTIVMGGGGYVIAKADGRTLVGTTVEDVGFDSRPTASGVANLLAIATRLAPSLADSTVASAWAGLRPGTADGMPLIGRLPGWAGVTLATGHYRNGILLAPITAELVADLLRGRSPRLSLAGFDPGRFLVHAA